MLCHNLRRTLVFNLILFAVLMNDVVSFGKFLLKCLILGFDFYYRYLNFARLCEQTG